MKLVSVKKEIQGIPYENGTLNFESQAFEGNHFSLHKQIKEAGLWQFTPDKAISLVYDASKNPKGEIEKEILDYLNKNGFYESAGVLWIPRCSDGNLVGGAFIEYNPKIKNGKVKMNKKDLTVRLKNSAKQVRSVLFSEDGLVRFVPFGFEIGEVDSLKGNDFVLAKYGEEGEEMADEIARGRKNKPFVGSYNSINKETLKVSCLCGCGGDRLDVVGIYNGVDDACRAFWGIPKVKNKQDIGRWQKRIGFFLLHSNAQNF